MVESNPLGGWQAKGTIEYGSALFTARLRLQPNGTVEMTDDRKTVEGLPVAIERFDDAGVRVRVEPRQSS